jgi:hypothetical protein
LADQIDRPEMTVVVIALLAAAVIGLVANLVMTRRRLAPL